MLPRAREVLREVSRRFPLKLRLWSVSVALAVALLRALWRKKLRRYVAFLRISSPLRGADVKYAQLLPQQTWYKTQSGRWYRWPSLFQRLRCSWNAFCPCCKRPLRLELDAAPPKAAVAPEAKGKYAYLICLWGSSMEYVLGAMVLGASIRKTGSKHDRVCLCTDDVPREHIERLSSSGLWQCRRISHVEVPMEQLSFPDREERFAHVFTKLRGLGLTEYEKVLMMDIDLLVRQNIDDLFSLPAPAALRRGMNDWNQSRHGRPIDGTMILLGEDKSQPRWSWGQGTGINAGVMLWQPNQEMLDEMLAELDEPNHPEHVRGNGPEQDYLSRTWADAPWTHIGAQYNFQLHQMFFALHPDRAQYAERANLLEHPERIKIVHYSGKPTAKPWHRVLDPRWKDFWPSRSRDEEYVKLFAEEFMGYWLWILRDAEKFQLQAEGPNASWDMARLELGEDGEYYRKDWRDPTVRQHLPIPPRRAQGAMQLLTSVLQEWFDIYQSLEAELPSLRYGAFASRLRPGPTRSLRPRLERPAGPAALKRTCWKRQSRQAWWMEVEKLPKSSQPPDAQLPQLQKITASCGLSPEGGSVSLRDSDSTFDEEGLDVEGLYIKHYGQVAARHFQIQDLSAEGLEPLQLWLSTIPDRAVLLMAVVGLAGDVTPLLRTLAPLGVPQEVPPEHCKVLACVSMAGDGSSERRPMANHASPDVAYASLLLDPQLL